MGSDRHITSSTCPHCSSSVQLRRRRGSNPNTHSGQLMAWPFLRMAQNLDSSPLAQVPIMAIPGHRCLPTTRPRLPKGRSPIQNSCLFLHKGSRGHPLRARPGSSSWSPDSMGQTLDAVWNVLIPPYLCPKPAQSLIRNTDGHSES